MNARPIDVVDLGNMDSNGSCREDDLQDSDDEVNHAGQTGGVTFLAKVDGHYERLWKVS